MGTDDFLRKANFSTEISPNGLRWLGWGVSRAVFEITVGELQGKVLKIARKQKTTISNKREIAVWKDARGTNVEDYFCPIDLEKSDTSNYEYLIMEYAEQDKVTEMDGRKTQQVRDTIGVKPIDFRPENVGLYNGRPVFIDYPWW